MFLRHNIKKCNIIVKVQNQIQCSHGNEFFNYDLLAHDVVWFGRLGKGTLKESGASIYFFPEDRGSMFLKMLVQHNCNKMTHRNAMEENW